MAEAGQDAKAKDFRKENCDHLQGVYCKKMGKRCNCASRFYKECPVFKGNFALNSFF